MRSEIVESMIIHGDSLEELKVLEDESVDLLCTDPPYGYSFMGKSWDKTLPDIGIFKECLRVLKPGSFAFVMSAPRSDVCARMMLMLEDAGFEIGFTPIYWTYASGFPKAMNIGKMVDKRNGRHQPDQEFKDYLKAAKKKVGLTSEQIDRALGFNSGVFSQHYVGNTHQVEYPTVEKYRELKKLLNLDNRYDELVEREEAEREVVGSKQNQMSGWNTDGSTKFVDRDITLAATDAAKALDGSYGGFQPKPAVEVVIVAMKPLSEKTYVDQALKNGKGITWLDDARIPIRDGASMSRPVNNKHGDVYGAYDHAGNPNNPSDQLGRFPANLLVSDDVLNDGTVQTSKRAFRGLQNAGYAPGTYVSRALGTDTIRGHNDSGGYSRFFSLDAWAQTLPFLAVPKASKSEKNAGLSHLPMKQTKGGGGVNNPSAGAAYGSIKAPANNFHPTVKPLKLMSYLITLGSRPGDVVLDPFLGSGTTCIAAKELGRKYIGIEREAEYHEIASVRINAIVPTLL